MREVVAALIVRNGMILLGKRAPDRAIYPGVWDVFGGHMEAGETQAQSLVRELDGELGIRPTLWEYLETLAEDHVEQYGDARYHFYRLTAWDGTPENRQPHEHTEIRWVPLDKAAQMELASPEYSRLFAYAVQRQDSGR